MKKTIILLIFILILAVCCFYISKISIEKNKVNKGEIKKNDFDSVYVHESKNDVYISDSDENESISVDIDKNMVKIVSNLESVKSFTADRIIGKNKDLKYENENISVNVIGNSISIQEKNGDYLFSGSIPSSIIPQEEVLTIGPYEFDCYGPFAQKCFVQIAPDGSKSFFYGHIEGFKFKKGYKYKLLVDKIANCTKSKIEICPKDLSAYSYKLKKIISKKKSNATFEKDFPKLENNVSIQDKKIKKNKNIIDLSIFPKAEKGYKRVVINLPKEKNELTKKVELLAYKKDIVDCNKKTLIGEFKKHTVSGWGYSYYNFTGKGQAISTLMLCPGVNNLKGDIFSREEILNYNSKVPIVVYVKDDMNIKYHILSRIK